MQVCFFRMTPGTRVMMHSGGCNARLNLSLGLLGCWTESRHLHFPHGEYISGNVFLVIPSRSGSGKYVRLAAWLRSRFKFPIRCHSSDATGPHMVYGAVNFIFPRFSPTGDDLCPLATPSLVASSTCWDDLPRLPLFSIYIYISLSLSLINTGYK